MTEPQRTSIRKLASSSPVNAFCRAVERYMEHGTPVEPLHLAARTLAAEALRLELRPEEILAAIKSTLTAPVAFSEQHRTDLSRRYSQSVHALISAYFAQRESGRNVVDSQGQRWHVYVVEEGGRWDPEIEMRRHNWLCCQSDDARRFIAPVPDGWREWSDDTLLEAIAGARHDHRAGPLHR